MTSEQILAAVNEVTTVVLDQYHAAEPRPVRYDPPANELERVEHLLYMAVAIAGFVDEGRLDKANRWLGFMQGTLWSLGWATIDELRAANTSAKVATAP